MASCCHIGEIDNDRNRYRMWAYHALTNAVKNITFFDLNYTNFNDIFKDNFMQGKVNSALVVLILSFASFVFFHHLFITFRSVLKSLFDDFFHIAFGYTIYL